MFFVLCVACLNFICLLWFDVVAEFCVFGVVVLISIVWDCFVFSICFD